MIPLHKRPSLAPIEAASILGVSYATVCRYLRQGKLPGTKAAYGWKIKTAEVFKYLSEHPKK